MLIAIDDRRDPGATRLARANENLLKVPVGNFDGGEKQDAQENGTYSIAISDTRPGAVML
jgi:hypothetical protein